MFGFSIQKLLVLVAVIGAVWYGFKLIGRLDQNRKAGLRQQGGERKAGGFPWSKRNQPADPGEAQDMVQCPGCQAYVPAQGASACERDDCPYG